MPTLIIISGPSASGKSTLADQLAADLRLPVIHRDTIKEAMFDTLGYSDRKQSKKFGIAAALVLIRQLEVILRAGSSCIIEGKFIPKFSQEELAQLLYETGASVVQVQCHCKGQILYDRFMQRALSPERHPGHDEASNLEDFKEELLAGKLAYLDLPGGALIEYDTTERNADRYQQLRDEINQAI